ncbi:IS5/IS1182 family transposase, partial [Nocardiopsis sp. frass1]
SPGERAIARLKQWDILRRLRCCPQRAGQITRAVLVLQLREAG